MNQFGSILDLTVIAGGHYSKPAQGFRLNLRKPLLEKLLGQIPSEACVLAYNASFEIGVLNQLAEWFPRYRGRLGNLVKNMKDLAEPFRKDTSTLGR
jgi:hypothetical protein